MWGVAFSPDGGTLASASRDNTVILWDAKTRTRRGEPLAGHTNSVTSVAFSPDGGTLASASFDHTVILWDAKTRTRLGEPLAGHTAAVRGVAFSPDGGTLASASFDGTVILWDVNPYSWKARAAALPPATFPWPNGRSISAPIFLTTAPVPSFPRERE